MRFYEGGYICDMMVYYWLYNGYNDGCMMIMMVIMMVNDGCMLLN